MSHTIAVLLLCTFTLAGNATAQRPDFINMPGATPQTPFSQAVRVGDLLYLSGMIGVKPGTTTLVAGGITAETQQTLENIKAVVERAGGSMDNVARCLVMLADMAEWGTMNETYIKFFPVNRPARSAVAVAGLALGARVEIECIAVLVK